MSQLNKLKSQIVISSWGGSRRAKPYAFTEQGVAMLSSVLRSKRAIEVNIAIMRAFVKLRELLATHKELASKLQDLEQQLKGHDEQIQTIFEAIQQLLTPPKQPRKKIYPVKSMLPPPAGVHYQDGSTTLNLPRVVNFI